MSFQAELQDALLKQTRNSTLEEVVRVLMQKQLPVVEDSWDEGFDAGIHSAWSAVQRMIDNPSLSQKLRDAGFTRRPSAKSLPSEE